MIDWKKEINDEKKSYRNGKQRNTLLYFLNLIFQILKMYSIFQSKQ